MTEVKSIVEVASPDWIPIPNDSTTVADITDAHDDTSRIDSYINGNVRYKKLRATRHLGDQTNYIEKHELLFQQQLKTKLKVRRKYLIMMVLRSLNGTFDSKYLKIPFKPDGLKFGRPVAASHGNSQSGNSIKNKYMNQCQQPVVKPDNGYFDSRVLSRNHAMLTCDPQTGKVYIHDLKSSNGTYVNTERIGQIDVEVKSGDIIDLGTDIDNKSEHRKISALVEDITIIPLVNEDITIWKETLNRDAHSKIITNTRAPLDLERDQSILQRAAYEITIFGYGNNVDLEDTILGLEPEILSGIFINNSIGTNSLLTNVLRTLATEISLEKHQLLKLESVEEFLNNYTTGVENLKKRTIENNDKHLAKLQTKLKEGLSEEYGAIIQEYNDRMKDIETNGTLIRQSFSAKDVENKVAIKTLSNKIEDLKTRLEVEKYKNLQRLKNDTNLEQDSKSNTVIPLEEDEDLKLTKSTSPGEYLYQKGFLKTLLIVSGFSVVLIAYAFNLPSK